MEVKQIRVALGSPLDSSVYRRLDLYGRFYFKYPEARITFIAGRADFSSVYRFYRFVYPVGVCFTSPLPNQSQMKYPVARIEMRGNIINSFAKITVSRSDR